MLSGMPKAPWRCVWSVRSRLLPCRAEAIGPTCSEGVLQDAAGLKCGRSLSITSFACPLLDPRNAIPRHMQRQCTYHCKSLHHNIMECPAKRH
eukprot:900126-Pyramimonas_sp.AAC.1